MLKKIDYIYRKQILDKQKKVLSQNLNQIWINYNNRVTKTDQLN